MNSFVIREAIDADHKFIVDFQLRMADETENVKLDKETVIKGVSEILKNSWRGYYLVAENDTQPVGVMLVLSEWSDWRNGEVLWIHSLYVVSGYRKQGVFKSFYRHLQEKVEANDQYRGIRLYVDKTNITAQKTYAAIGMSNEHYDLFEWMK
jgi:ribosomal protein S18 acetylase RimI-like enzyme